MARNKSRSRRVNQPPPPPLPTVRTQDVDIGTIAFLPQAHCDERLKCMSDRSTSGCPRNCFLDRGGYDHPVSIVKIERTGSRESETLVWFVQITSTEFNDWGNNTIFMQTGTSPASRISDSRTSTMTSPTKSLKHLSYIRLPHVYCLPISRLEPWWNDAGLCNTKLPARVIHQLLNGISSSIAESLLSTVSVSTSTQMTDLEPTLPVPGEPASLRISVQNGSTQTHSDLGISEIMNVDLSPVEPRNSPNISPILPSRAPPILNNTTPRSVPIVSPYESPNPPLAVPQAVSLRKDGTTTSDHVESQPPIPEVWENIALVEDEIVPQLWSLARFGKYQESFRGGAC